MPVCAAALQVALVTAGRAVLLGVALAGALLAGLALAGCSGTRRLVLFERDAGSDAGTRSEPDAGCAECGTALGLDGGLEGALHGGVSGTLRSDLCPAQQVLIGCTGSVQDIGLEPLPVIGSLQGLCASLRLAPDGAVHTDAGASLPVRGDPETPSTLARFEQRCAAGHVVVAVEGRAGLALDRLALVCARLQARMLDGGVAFERGGELALPAQGGDGGSAFREPCPPGWLANGLRLRSGRWIDGFGLVCARPTAEN